ncbi:MAG: hypothetical protein RL226_2324, partial [Bacteroidota bacterium]
QMLVELDGQTYSFTLSGTGKSILDSVIKEGGDAPFSCRGGVCTTCMAKVLEGEVRMDSNLALTDGEIQEGFILTCQAHPVSGKVRITYDF